MSDARTEGGSIVVHQGRAYDVLFGWLIRRSDEPVLRLAGVGPGDRVLDVGTGPGYLALAARRLVGPGGQAVGIDASPEMITLARRRAARERSEAQYHVASADSLPLPDASFDVVVSRLVLHHLTGNTRRGALAEMLRVLRPGGRLLIADIGSPIVSRAHHLVARVLGAHPEPGSSLERLVQDSGFQQVSSHRLMHGFLTGVAACRPPEPGETGLEMR